MDVDIKTEPNNTENDQEVKVQTPEKLLPSPDLIPSEKTSNSNDDITNLASKQNNGNGNEKNGQKRIKTVPDDDGSKKKPRKSMPFLSIKKENNESMPEASSLTDKEVKNQIDLSNVEEHYLTIFNFPRDWSYVQIKKYLNKECGIDEIEMVKKEDSQNCAIKLTFPTDSAAKCKEAYEKLKNKVIEEKKLRVEMKDPLNTYSSDNNNSPQSSNQIDRASVTTEIVPERPWRPDRDIWETDPQGLYGLRPQFLKSLNITTPLDRWVHVSNFRCDKTELKEVMELAGNVLMCCVVTVINKYALVLYSHPLEAVQAISMLDGQTYYGTSLKVKIYRNPKDTLVLPKGLANIGQGLGINGRPIYNIAQQYQRYARKESSLINPLVFSEINDPADDRSVIFKDDDDEDEIQRKINDDVNTKQYCNSPNHISFYVKNVDELEIFETHSKEGSNRSTPDTNTARASPGQSRKSSIGSVPLNQIFQTNDGVGTPANNLMNAPVRPVQTPNTLGDSVPIGTNNQNSRGFPRPGLLQNLQASIRNPLPIPTLGHSNYMPGPNNFPNQPRPIQFGQRPLVGPAFGPQPIGSAPRPFGSAPGSRPQMPLVNFRGPRPFGGQTSAAPRPNLNTGNRVTVNFSNLPPTTTFPLLCDKLSQCGQVISVQLTTPGCAVATFAHPSHAERCFQTFNRMSIEGYIIEVKFA